MLICSFNFNAWGQAVGRVDNAIQLINPIQQISITKHTALSILSHPVGSDLSSG